MPAGAPPAIRYVASQAYHLFLLPFADKNISGRKISEKHDKVFVTGCLEPDTSKPRANAAFVVLARNKELDGVIQSMKSIERHFNRWYNYPYVFLNDGDFNQTFMDTVQNYTKSKVEFGKVGPDMWGYPDWIDPKVAKEGINKQGDNAIMYGGLESYHFMCRFYSGYATTRTFCCLCAAVLIGRQLLLQAPAPRKVRMVLASRARDQVLL